MRECWYSLVLSPTRKEEIMGDKVIRTNCYKCEVSIDTYEDKLHPLCDQCQDDFQAWFWAQVSMFDKAGKE